MVIKHYSKIDRQPVYVMQPGRNVPTQEGDTGNTRFDITNPLLWIAFIISIFTGPLFARTVGNPVKTIHAVVALCDNFHQGIVPVPPKLGNGRDPGNNLYWGAKYGVKSSFNRNREWALIKTWKNPSADILERLIYKHRFENVFLLADAYDGEAIRRAVIDFLSYAGAGKPVKISSIPGKIPILFFGGNSDLTVYVGHDGLMDFSLKKEHVIYRNSSKKRETVILACISYTYFYSHLKAGGACPLVWTTGLMAPEAYTLEAILKGWIAGETSKRIHRRAAEAYHKYQKCGLKNAEHLFKTGW